MTKDFLYEYIHQFRFAVLATVSSENVPESAYVGIAVTRDLQIIFDTTSDSKKYLNLLLNPNIAFVIGWDNEKTVQYEGVARVPDSEELEQLLPTYFEVFPDGKERREKWKNIAYICVDPKWIRFSDFKKSQIEETKF